MSSAYGIEENSSLNYLQYPHVIDGLPLDIVHDILEGFATDSLQKPLSYFMHLKALTPEMVNVSKSPFNYSRVYQINKPHALKFFNRMRNVELS